MWTFGDVNEVRAEFLIDQDLRIELSGELIEGVQEFKSSFARITYENRDIFNSLSEWEGRIGPDTFSIDLRTMDESTLVYTTIGKVTGTLQCSVDSVISVSGCRQVCEDWGVRCGANARCIFI